jgi:competence protein ComEC
MKKNLLLVPAILLAVVIALFIKLNATESHLPQSSIDMPLTVHYVDVGQADCTLIQLPDGKTMLIDAGNNDDADLIVAYLKRQGIQKLDYVIGTHPHEDHIGSLDAVIDTFDIVDIYMPKASANTKTYRDVLTSIQKKGLSIHTAKGGMTVFDTGDTKAELLAPNSDTYKSLNNYSVVLKLSYQDTSFLFCGDAEKESEKEILQSGSPLSSNVLKVGHHGSASSTTDAFLSAVNPDIAVITCGKDNSYGHPHKETLQKLAQRNINVFRTDESGTVVLGSNGKQIAQKQE